MKRRVQTDILLDSGRQHAESEVRLVAAVFQCSVETARKILDARPSREKLAEVRGMLDANMI